MMNEKKVYAGIDCFRYIAALFVIAIHTSPLASFSETGDFIFTRIIARIAVPFFMMTSGFFLISRYAYNTKKLQSFLKKTALIYGVSMLIYLPVNIYNGYFHAPNLLPELLKDICFDGTMYHLWYLPASMMGAGIAWYLIRRLKPAKALGIALVLYVMGLFGDSYYGIAEQIPVLKEFYRLVFQVSDYTRNGVFYAPLFFMLGGRVADRASAYSERRMSNGKVPIRARIIAWKCLCGFGVSTILMFAEAILLKQFCVFRHDSMYIFLPSCMYFLFPVILQWKGRIFPDAAGAKNRARIAFLRNGSLILYIVHPMMIIVLRFAAKILHLEGILIENSILHYLAVCLLSAIFSIAAARLWNTYQKLHWTGILHYGKSGAGRDPFCPGTDRAWIELNVNHLKHNVKILQEALPERSELMAVIKDNAYGHGVFTISTQLNKLGVKAFAIATIEEGIQLRKFGILGEILILGYTNPGRVKELKKYDLTQTLIDFAYAKSLNQQGIPVKAHIKIDTGMHRLGISCDSFLKVKKCFTMKYLKITGIYTHLSCADSLEAEDVSFTRYQITNFYNLIEKLKQNGILIPKLHIQSSYGLLNYPDLACDYVRAGIALYGVLSTPGNTRLKLDLRPVLSLKTRIILIRNVSDGNSIGYGRSYTAEEKRLIAILSIGYGDGIPRNLSGEKSGVIIRGQYAPILGRICMDQLTVDITDIKNASIGDVATLLSSEEQTSLLAPAIAKQAGTISNELLCRLGTRLPILIS